MIHRLLLLLFLCTPLPAQDIKGIYEACIGVSDPIPQIAYWQRFGYRVGPTGSMSAADAHKHYGVKSALLNLVPDLAARRRPSKAKKKKKVAAKTS